MTEDQSVKRKTLGRLAVDFSGKNGYNRFVNQTEKYCSGGNT
jgi:hypothetical protein